jgi:hypothetical protein
MTAPYTGGCQCGSALRIDDGTDTPGCLPLQGMPAPIRQRLRHVHAGEERQPDNDWSTKQFTRIADSGNEVAGVFCPECGVRTKEVRRGTQFSDSGTCG